MILFHEGKEILPGKNFCPLFTFSTAIRDHPTIHSDRVGVSCRGLFPGLSRSLLLRWGARSPQVQRKEIVKGTARRPHSHREVRHVL